MSRIGLIGDNSIEYIEILIDIWNNGDCAVLIDWRIPHNIALKMISEASVCKCFIDKRLVERIRDHDISNIEFIQFYGGKDFANVIPEYIYGKYKNNDSSKEAVILYSSGTTGKSKGVILSHYAINTNANLIAEYMALEDGDCLYIVKTLAHASTLVGELLVALKKQIKTLLSPTVNNVRQIIENITTHKVSAICTNPTLLNLYTLAVNTQKVSLKGLKTIYTSGAIAEASLIEKAQKAFPHTEVLNVYGLSEAGPRVAAQRRGDISNVKGSVGKPLNKIDIAIVSNDGLQMPKMKKGIIHVKSPCLFTNYVSGELARKSLYNNYLNTGDIGYMDENNNLMITGRVDNMVTVDSHNIYPEEIEILINKNQLVKDCVIIPQKNVSRGNKLLCFYEADKDISYQLKRICVASLATYEIPSTFIRVNKIPVNNGKKSRDLNKYISYIK